MNFIKSVKSSLATNEWRYAKGDLLTKNLNIMTAKEIAEKYVYGRHDALTDSQEVKDMISDIDEYAKKQVKLLATPDVMPSCLTCLYSNNGASPCNRHLHKIPPDYSKGYECFYNNFAHYRHFRHKA